MSFIAQGRSNHVDSSIIGDSVLWLPPSVSFSFNVDGVRPLVVTGHLVTLGIDLALDSVISALVADGGGHDGDVRPMRGGMRGGDGWNGDRRSACKVVSQELSCCVTSTPAAAIITGAAVLSFDCVVV